MRHTCLTALTLATLLGTSVSLAAQTRTVNAGTIVRAELAAAPNEWLEGTLVSRTADSLTLVTRSAGALVQLAASNVRSLEILNGKRRLAPAAKWAIIGGGVWGLIVAALPYTECNPARFDCTVALSRTDFIAEQVLGMAITAGGIAAYRGEDRWVRVEGSPVRAMVVTSSGRTAIGVRIAR